MFTIEQIQTLHAKVKSGADFPRYVQDLIEIGVQHYTVYVADGRTVYTGKNNFSLTINAQYGLLPIASKGNKEQLQQTLKIHQQGTTDYFTFCLQAAQAGVEKWIVDMQQMTCTYYDSQGNLMVEEKIPAFN